MHGDMHGGETEHGPNTNVDEETLPQPDISVPDLMSVGLRAQIFAANPFPYKLNEDKRPDFRSRTRATRASRVRRPKTSACK